MEVCQHLGHCYFSRILTALREEGLLAKPKGKTSGGLSFEVVDASVVERREAAMAAAGGGSLGSSLGSANDAFVSARFMPKNKLERLEQRRVVSWKNIIAVSFFVIRQHTIN